ncbi:coiled-coil domain-containing protein, partial [Streptomyces sp. Act-28]
MRLPHGRWSLPGSVLTALALLIALPFPSAAAPAAEPDGPAVSAEVARLLTEASRVTEAYERGRHAAAAPRAWALRLQKELDDKRRDLAVLHGRAGEVARAQYRTGGSLPATARLLLADDPQDALRAERAARQAGQAMDLLVRRTDRAERLLEAAAIRARAAWRDLEARHVRLAALRRGLEARLER